MWSSVFQEHSLTRRRMSALRTAVFAPSPMPHHKSESKFKLNSSTHAVPLLSDVWMCGWLCVCVFVCRILTLQ